MFPEVKTAYVCAACESSAVHIQVVLSVCREAALEEGAVQY